jgi:hypothetical protein
MKSLMLKAHGLGANGILTRAQMKNVFGGGPDLVKPGCGTGISCAGKSEFQTCGSKGTCGCTTVSGGGSTYYCRTDMG